MPSADSPSDAPADHVVVVGMPGHRGPIVSAVAAMGMAAIEAEDPYAAMTELCRGAGRYRAVVLSLQGLHREELPMIAAVHRLGASAADGASIEVWLADLDGRALALAEAMRLGVDALLVEDGLHRISTAMPTAATTADAGASPAEEPGRSNDVADYLNRRADGPELAGPKATDRDSAARELSVWHEIAGGTSAGRSPAGNDVATASADGTRRSAAPAAVLAEAFEDEFEDPSPGEPVLTAEELRALLQDQPDLP